MKKKVVSIIFYILNIALFFIPWITVGDNAYNIFQFAYLKSMNGIEYFADKISGPVYVSANALNSGTSIEIMLMFLILLLSVVYLFTIFWGKKYPVNLAVLALGVIVGYYHHKFVGTLNDLCGGSVISVTCSLMFILIPAIEYFTVMIMERWRETVDESVVYQKAEEARKKERKERLAFVGKYDTPFYRVVWKNFKSNWKDYILLLFCCSLIFGFVVIGYGIQKLMSLEYNLEDIQMLNGLNSILINAIVPLAIISVFIIIMLLFYYLKCRSKNYGVFLTLGMRRKALYYFAGLEFASVFLIAVIVGGLLGTFVLFLFTHYSEMLLGSVVEFSAVGFMTYLKSVLTVVIVFGASAMLARDIFLDFNVGKSTDHRAIGEPIPMRFRKLILAAGILICGFCIFQYGQLRNFEKIYYLLGFFVGLFIVIRYGIAEYLIKTRRKSKYLRKMVVQSQLFHKSKTSAGYIFALALMQFCVLFYFSFQVVSCEIVEDNDTLFPYDMICIADDEDDEFFEGLQEKYEIELETYPMVRVSNYDSTEKWEGPSDGDPIQGQQIGISESTYHALKKKLDLDYEATDLGLDAKGKKIYIVHQQDKSIKAQPVDFYGSAKKPIMAIGLPANEVDTVRVSHSWDDVIYQYREIVGEEIGSLTGAFRQGLRENLIVFSDEFFEEAQGYWEISDLQSGLFTTMDYYQEYYSEPDESLFNYDVKSPVYEPIIKQGPTKLVLINANEADMDEIIADMQEFKEKHADEEAYDASVSSYYTKQEAVNDLQTERYMKIVMNMLVIAIFFVMNLVLVSIKMLSELDMNRRRADFLTCMGMREKDRDKLVKKEILYYHHFVPMIIAIVSALIFTFTIFRARMYTAIDMQNYFAQLIPVWGIYIVGSTALLWILSMIYARSVEGKKYARRS